VQEGSVEYCDPDEPTYVIEVDADVCPAVVGHSGIEPSM
jgi:hypothetical protein